MTATLPEIDSFLRRTGLAYEVWPCDPDLADTAAFCAHYLSTICDMIQFPLILNTRSN